MNHLPAICELYSKSVKCCTYKTVKQLNAAQICTSTFSLENTAVAQNVFICRCTFLVLHSHLHMHLHTLYTYIRISAYKSMPTMHMCMHMCNFCTLDFMHVRFHLRRLRHVQNNIYVMLCTCRHLYVILTKNG